MTHLPPATPLLFRIFPPAFLVLACLQRDSVYAVTVGVLSKHHYAFTMWKLFCSNCDKSNEKEWFHFEKNPKNETEKNASSREII